MNQDLLRFQTKIGYGGLEDLILQEYLNPIETIWGAIKKMLKWDFINTADEAITNIINTWDSFPQLAINNLVSSFQKRVELVLHSNGRTIQPLISAHKINVPEGYPIISTNTKSWGQEEDDLLLEKVKLLGKKWTHISQYFKGRSLNQIRKRYLYIQIKNYNHKKLIYLPHITTLDPQCPFYRQDIFQNGDSSLYSSTQLLDEFLQNFNE